VALTVFNLLTFKLLTPLKRRIETTPAIGGTTADGDEAR